MLERKILYYPTIIPPLTWLKWATLYWDKTSTIIPESWEDDPQFANERDKKSYDCLKYLEAEECFEATRPEPKHPILKLNKNGKYVKYKSVLEDTQDEFLQVIASKDFPNLVKEAWGEDPVKEGGKSWMLYEAKMTDLLKDAFRSKYPQQLVYSPYLKKSVPVPKKIFLLYMAILAKNLADVDSNHVITSTDRPEYETMTFEAFNQDKKNSFMSLRTKLFDVLPVAREDISIREIVKFKKENKSRLLDFRVLIDDFQVDVSNAKDPKEIKQVTIQYGERIAKEREKLNDTMNEAKIKTASSFLSSLVNIKSPALLETIGFSLAKVPPTISIPIIATTATLQVAYALIDQRNEKSAKMRNSPFSYLYCAEHKKIIQ